MLACLTPKLTYILFYKEDSLDDAHRKMSKEKEVLHDRGRLSEGDQLDRAVNILCPG